MIKCLNCGECSFVTLNRNYTSNPKRDKNAYEPFVLRSGEAYNAWQDKQEDKSLCVERLACSKCGVIIDKVTEKTLKYVMDFDRKI